MSPHNQMFTDLRTALLAYSALSTLVGTSIARERIPQGTPAPLVCMHHIGSEDIQTHTSPWEDTGERTARVQFDCDALTASGADDLANTLKLAMKTALWTSATTKFGRVKFEDSFSQSIPTDATAAQGADGYYRVSLTYEIQFTN